MNKKKCEIGVILAGGKGSRLQSLTRAIPKELLPINGIPIIDYVIRQMKFAEIKKLYIVVGYRKEAIINYIGSGKRYGINVAYVYQDEQLGTADALSYLSPFINETFCLIYGDEYLQPEDSLLVLKNIHFGNKGNATLGVIETKKEDQKTTAMITTDSYCKVLDIIEKPKKEIDCVWGSNGTYVFEPVIFDYIDETEIDVDKEVNITNTIKAMMYYGEHIYAFKNAEIHFDIGEIERYQEANRGALKIDK